MEQKSKYWQRIKILEQIASKQNKIDLEVKDAKA
jgi:hypothetical protein